LGPFASVEDIKSNKSQSKETQIANQIHKMTGEELVIKTDERANYRSPSPGLSKAGKAGKDQSLEDHLDDLKEASSLIKNNLYKL
jgi:hypothetical protein